MKKRFFSLVLFILITLSACNFYGNVSANPQSVSVSDVSSESVSVILTVSPTADPTKSVTPTPTGSVTPVPTESPTASPTQKATASPTKKSTPTATEKADKSKFDYNALSPFDGENPYAVVNNNIPFFEDSEKTTSAFENYAALDALGRCGVTFANICREIMPTEKRGDIGSVKPTGWQYSKYDFVDGKYLYNRCHLIGYQLSGENANKSNLVTGTRYMNTQGMLPFENMVADYVKETENHVLYRVTPVFIDKELVCRGVLMEAESVEDGGEGIQFCVFCYNVQPGVKIDYATGDNVLDGSEPSPSTTQKATATATPNPTESASDVQDYVLNTNTMKFHYPYCDSCEEIYEKNKAERRCTRQELLDEGYSPCGRCKP